MKKEFLSLFVFLIQLPGVNSLVAHAQEKTYPGQQTGNKKASVNVKIILTSTHSWTHFNLMGEYDFSEGKEFKKIDFELQCS